jgi:hypothetical protein
MDLWLEWLDYKDEIKKQYKTQRGAKSAFTEFKHLAGGDYGKAHAIIEQSFRRSWDGLFDVKDYVPNMFEQPTQVPQQTERALRKFCAFNVAFDTEKEADSFYDEQMRIRDGYYAGIYKAADRHAEDWIVQGNAVKLVDGVIYDYEQ